MTAPIAPEAPQGDPAVQGDPKPDPKPEEQLGDAGKKALNAERDARKAADTKAADLQKKLDVANAQLTAAKNDGLPEWQQKFNELQEKLDGALEAQRKAEETAKAATLAQLRADRASANGLPAALAKKLTGTTAEELDTEIDELLPLLAPTLDRTASPQQGRPSKGRATGKELGTAEADKRFGPLKQ